MHSNSILDPAAKLLICHMVFVRNVQGSPLTSFLKGLDPPFEFCCKGPVLKGIKEGQLNFEPRRQKTCFCHMRTTKAQISLRIRCSLPR